MIEHYILCFDHMISDYLVFIYHVWYNKKKCNSSLFFTMIFTTMQQILFTDPDPYENYKNLAIFTLMCGVDAFQRPLPSLHLQDRRLLNHQRRVSTKMSPSHLFLLEFAAEKKVYPILSINEQANNFARIN